MAAVCDTQAAGSMGRTGSPSGTHIKHPIKFSLTGGLFTVPIDAQRCLTVRGTHSASIQVEVSYRGSTINRL